MAAENEVILQLTARTEEAEARIKKLEEQLNKTKDAAKKVSEDGIERIVKNGGAMGILNDLTGGLAMQFKDAYESIQLTNTGLKGMKAALLATGIGAAVVAIGLLATNFDKLKEAFFPVNQEAERFIEIQKKANEQSAKEITQLEILRARINSQNTSLKQRADIINDLQKKYPAFLKNIDAEKVGYEEINEAINNVNNALLKKSTLEVVQEELTELIKKQRDLNAENEKYTDQINKVFSEHEKEWGSLSEQDIKDREGLLERQRQRYEEESQTINNSIRKTTQEVISLQNELSGMFETQTSQSVDSAKTAQKSESEILKQREKDQIDSIDAVTEKQRQAYEQRLIMQQEAEHKEAEARLQGVQNAEEMGKRYLEEMKKQREQEKADLQATEEAKVIIRQQYEMAAFAALTLLAGKNQKAQKALALAQIGYETGKGFIQGLTLAQTAAQGTGPAAAFAFPIFYATQIAAVLAAAGRAKSALDSGGAGGGGGGGTPSFGGGQAPTPTNPQPALDFSFLNQNQPVQTYVIADDVKNANEANQKLKDQSTL